MQSRGDALWELLALALYRSGRQVDALAALRKAREVLADEWGIDPPPAMQKLEAEVLAQARHSHGLLSRNRHRR